MFERFSTLLAFALAHPSWSSDADDTTPNSYCKANRSFGRHALGCAMPTADVVISPPTVPHTTYPTAISYKRRKLGIHRDVAFRSWITSVPQDHWYTIYCCEPNLSGQTPFYIAHYRSQHLSHTSEKHHLWCNLWQPTSGNQNESTDDSASEAALQEANVPELTAMTNTNRRLWSPRFGMGTPPEPTPSGPQRIEKALDQPVPQPSPCHAANQPTNDSLLNYGLTTETPPKRICHCLPVNLRITPGPNWAPPITLHMFLSTTVQNFFTNPTPQHVDWQLPSRLLDDTQDPGSHASLTM